MMKCFLWKDGPYGATFLAIATDVPQARRVMLDELERQGNNDDAAPYTRTLIRSTEPTEIDLPAAFNFG